MSTCINNKFRWNAIALMSLNIQEYNKSPEILYFLHVLSSHSIIAIRLYEDAMCIHGECAHAYFA